MYRKTLSWAFFLFFEVKLSTVFLNWQVESTNRNRKRVQNKKKQGSLIRSVGAWRFLREKVRTTKIRTSKFKKNIENVSKHQNIESVFLVHHYYYNQNNKSVFLVHHYYDNQNIEKDIEIDFRCSDFTCGVKKDQNVQKIEISTTYGVLPMVTKPCGALGG